jgi:hypothetical protein
MSLSLPLGAPLKDKKSLCLLSSFFFGILIQEPTLVIAQ